MELFLKKMRPIQYGRYFPDDNFKCIVINENACISFKISLKFVPNQQYSSIGSDNGLAPSRRQAIIWTNDGLVYWHIYASLYLNQLKISMCDSVSSDI